MSGWMRSLRGRLTGAMLLVSLLAIAASALIDDAGLSHAIMWPRHGVLSGLGREPYQDGLVLTSLSLVLLALIWLVSGWSLKPLARASAEAALAGPDRPDARLSTDALPAEIRPLAVAVNGALDRLGEAIAAERRFTADAAHGLRTPLAVLRLRLQRARLTGEADWPAVEQDLAQMGRLVDQLLDLARKDHAGRADQAEPVNLARIGREGASLILPRMEAAQRRLSVDLPDALTVSGHAGDLRDLVLALLDNALLHGAGEVSLSGFMADGLAVLCVGDEGGGVPAPLRQAVFQRFGTAGHATSGTGLGLAIVAEVARLHGGSARFADGPRCCVEVRLPVLTEARKTARAA